MIATLALALLAAAPSSRPAAAAPAAAGDFRPDLFFAGHTRGTGTVSIMTSSKPRVLAVQGTGRVEPDGTLVLDQAVRQDDKLSQRSFRIRHATGGSWQGTLSDAAGPVRGTVTGNTLHLAYRMKGAGLHMDQTLTLQPGGRTVLNRARVTLMGVQVARIEETIEKID